MPELLSTCPSPPTKLDSAWACCVAHARRRVYPSRGSTHLPLPEPDGHGAAHGANAVAIRIVPAHADAA